MSDTNDVEVVRKLKAGSESQFKALFDQYFGLILFVVRKYGLAEAVCDEIVQETYLKLWKKREELSEKTVVKAWLILTAKNSSIDYLRKKRPVATGEIEDVAAESDVVAEKIEREVEIELVRDFILEVEKETGEKLLSLFYLENKTAKEIAEARGEAVSTVTTKLTRLRRKFKNKLQIKMENHQNQ